MSTAVDGLPLPAKIRHIRGGNMAYKKAWRKKSPSLFFVCRISRTALYTAVNDNSEQSQKIVAKPE